MLTFAALLWITVAAVDLDGAFRQSPKDYKAATESVQSTIISKSPVVMRRMNALESITKSQDQRDDDFPVSIGYKEASPEPESGESVNDILQHSLIELTDTLRTLETNDPFKATRTPLQRIAMQIPESLMAFQSLLEMLSNSKESRSPTQWQRYLSESIRRQQCSEMDLCREFKQHFKCDDGRLVAIMLDHKGSFDHLNLRMIPNTVKVLYLSRIKLKTISEWKDLKGKSLKNLSVDRNSDLKLNLDGLKRELNYLALENLIVSRSQITSYFGMQSVHPTDPAFCRVQEWMKVSILDQLRIYARGCGQKRGDFLFFDDGTYTRN